MAGGGLHLFMCRGSGDDMTSEISLKSAPRSRSYGVPARAAPRGLSCQRGCGQCPHLRLLYWRAQRTRVRCQVGPQHVAFGCPSAGARGSQVSSRLPPGCLKRLDHSRQVAYETLHRAPMLAWTMISYAAALSVFTALILVSRERRPGILIATAVGAFAGPLPGTGSQGR